MLLAPILLLMIQALLLGIFSFFAFFNYLYGVASFWSPRITRTTHSGRRIAVVIVSANEKFVIEETIRACDKLTYPDKIIVLADDSEDPELREKHRRLAADRGCHRVEGHRFYQEIPNEGGEITKIPIELWESPDFVYIHRPVNTGFKAGSIRNLHGYLRSRGIELMYLLDADWHPQRDALERCLEVLEAQPNVAFVQTKRVTFSRGMNLFQRYVALCEEGCYYVDQEGRQVLGHPILFSGCCTLMRLDAIERVGGFTPGHLTEDLDLTDRFWINGWKGVYLGTVVNYGEVPYAYDHFRRQQERWVAGTARALKDYFRPLLATPHLGWLHKMGAIRQNAYYTTGLFTVLALLVAAATLLWIYTGRDTYPVEYYLYLTERYRMPLMIIVYWCLLSNLVEMFIMIVVKKRTYTDLLHAPMAVWYAWSTLATYVAGNLKGLFGIQLGWFLTPKFLRGSVGAFSVVPSGMRTVNCLICTAFIAFFFLEGAIIGGGGVFAILWIPAFLLASME